MNERSILFRGEMVKAIVEGRMTQTRRVMKPQPILDGLYYEYNGVPWLKTGNPFPFIGHLCPYGHSGDRLWVREEWRLVSVNADIPGAKFWTVQFADFHALPHPQSKQDVLLPIVKKDKLSKNIIGDELGKWRPPIFMPRWASRITLDVVNVKVDRLQEISGNDVVEEGIDGLCRCGEYVKYHGYGSGHSPVLDEEDAIEKYRYLWNSINGKPKPVYVDKKIVSYECFPWSNEDFESSYPGVRQARAYRGRPIVVIENPWVWVVEFMRCDEDVD